MHVLPGTIEACLFDLDGVLTDTAVIHAAAWKQAFDSLLAQRAGASGGGFRSFDAVRDYDEFVDGRPRDDGIRAFLASRGITLDEGSPDDPPAMATVHGVGRFKNDLFVARLAGEGIRAYPGSRRFLAAVRAEAIKCAVVSSSTNCAAVLTAAGIAGLFDVVVDGTTARRRHLAGKPAPDTYLAAARDLGVEPSRAAVFEDALAGVAAGRAGGFAWVVGVDRVDQGEALRAHGADVVVSDLAELLSA